MKKLQSNKKKLEKLKNKNSGVPTQKPRVRKREKIKIQKKNNKKRIKNPNKKRNKNPNKKRLKIKINKPSVNV